MVIWKHSRSGIFSSQSMTEVERGKHQKVDWHKGGTPKHAFVLWLAIKGKLLKQTRLKNMGISMANRS